ncbi:MAG: archaellin/type IV pilin N-terminal domain-containing protein [Nitrososphaeria archaeon]
MTKSGKKNKAISPIIATLILIVITVIAGIALYGFVSSYMSTITPTNSEPPNAQFIAEKYTPTTITNTEIIYNSFNYTIQNAGSTPLTITKAYIINATNNQLISVANIETGKYGGTPGSVTIAPNQIMLVNVSTTNTLPSGSYYVRFATSNGYSLTSPTAYVSLSEGIWINYVQVIDPSGGATLIINVSVTGISGYISVGVNSGSSQIFFAPGAPGLEYQIYYSNKTKYLPPENLVYSAPLSNGTSFSSNGYTYTASTEPFYTALSGTTQNVDGNNQTYVINNFQYEYKGGSPFPNPPVSNASNTFAIKEIGYAVVTQPTVFYIDDDDGGVLGIVPYSNSYPNETSWLGGTSNPGNLINEWKGEGATEYSSPQVLPGVYAIEYDYGQLWLSAYFSLWSNSSVLYYHPLFLNSGQSVLLNYTMPVSLTTGQVVTVFATAITPSGTFSTNRTVVVSSN